jgi:hypothetical protein
MSSVAPNPKSHQQLSAVSSHHSRQHQASAFISYHIHQVHQTPKLKIRSNIHHATPIMSSTIPKLRYLSAWFCPYAHRATIALEHHAGRVEYEWVEVSLIYLVSVVIVQ